MIDLFEWEGTDKNGRSRKYQTKAPASETESAVLAHLRQHYRNLTITSIRRLDPNEEKPATGIVERHTYNFGIIDAVERELGLNTAERFRGSLLQYVQKKRRNPRDAEEFGVELMKQFDDAVDAAREARRVGRSALSVGRSLISS